MSTLAEIEKAVEMLPAAEMEVLFAHLAARLGRLPEVRRAGERQVGLHAGVWTIEADFDAALPDDFWMGREVCLR